MPTSLPPAQGTRQTRSGRGPERSGQIAAGVGPRALLYAVSATAAAPCRPGGAARGQPQLPRGPLVEQDDAHPPLSRARARPDAETAIDRHLHFVEPGLSHSPEVVERFHDMEIACLATDTMANECTVHSSGAAFMLHAALMRNLGVTFAEILSLDDLAADCAQADREDPGRRNDRAGQHRRAGGDPADHARRQVR